jgi:hypothetical protein
VDRRYIFPGGYAPALSEVFAALERAGLWVTDVEILRLHYANTLREWSRRSAEHRGQIQALYDFADQSVDLYLAEVVRRVRDGDLDDSLVYRKNLRKDTEQSRPRHPHTSPPHASRDRRGNVSSATS